MADDFLEVSLTEMDKEVRLKICLLNFDQIVYSNEIYKFYYVKYSCILIVAR